MNSPVSSAAAGEDEGEGSHAASALPLGLGMGQRQGVGQGAGRGMGLVPRLLLFATLFVPFCWVISAAAPLMTYTTALALFGLPHVWAELGYVEGRFGPRLARRLVIGWSIFLSAIILVRVLAWTGLLEWKTGAPMELLLVGAMVVIILPELWAKGLAQTAAGLVAGGAFVMGAAIVPSFMLVCLAVAHNATPVGFLAERLRGRDRLLAMAWCVGVFAV
ncbi:MAG: hypothetical protein ACAI35_14765, partial [Candidatus Methylacidiphilales bacterium]|nr:hypothetical protein [Candidatus Methylacidiphilales bacterium]